ncbi:MULTISPECIES: hypothetical protein [Winogradskyella]|uniref:hypothetical protein n=1 Tax=Winogradskyella TaxID=286104 RepID=UPI0015B90BF7|nr:MULTISPECIES: hypothetical protein [Winogradskyella]
MQFTRYFSKVLRENGTPDINVNEYQRMLNIIVLENQIDIIKRVKLNNRHNDKIRYMEKELFDLQHKLNFLTRENKPEHLLKYMLNSSRFEH